MKKVRYVIAMILRLQSVLWLLILILAGCNLETARPLSRLDGGEQLFVAWVEEGNLMVWRQGDDIARRIASGGVIQPFIAPDGERIAFTRGPAGIAETLWIVDSEGIAERMLAGDGSPRVFRDTATRVGQVAWLDETTLYFNTYAGQIFATRPNDDLYRVNVRTSEVSLILPKGEGGQFVFSPNRAYIAVTSVGTYGRQDARIRVIDPLALQTDNDLLFYVGVATGAETVFHPHLDWTPDNQVVLSSIPDPDLIYSELDADAPPVTLWRLSPFAQPERDTIGRLSASFFGLPTWSDDASQMLYLRRMADSNQFTVVIADGNGENAIDYLSGDVGTIERPRWLPASNRFYYTTETPGKVMLGERGHEPELLSLEAVLSPHFLNEDFFVFVTAEANTPQVFALHYARPNQQSIPIAHVGSRIPRFDAIILTTLHNEN